MEPRYSVLLCGCNLSDYSENLAKWLKKGIKVIWFGTTDDCEKLEADYKEYKKIFLMQAYVYAASKPLIIVDGVDKEGFVTKVLSKDCTLFNSAQYLVEHCQSDKHIIVQASAGTGKTTVMIDRILYLLHMHDDLKLSEVFMITFTNDATDQMNKRLQDALMSRYRLTRNIKYLRWVEEQSQMHISTIHSFAYYLLKEYGISESFTKNLSIRSFQYEKKELVKNLIDELADENKSVISQLGIPFYKANSTAVQFWDGFSKLGISHSDIRKMDWGQPLNAASKPFHGVITGILDDLDDKYFDIKRRNEAVSIDDIMRDLQKVLTSAKLPVPDLSMKYLFIDEFQDTDLAQINVACVLVKLLNPCLFVVGDVKQSIYRFRGANDQAFTVLKQDMKDMGITAPVEFTLINNYRTSANVLKRLDHYFKTWAADDMLQYDKSVIPFNQDNGRIKILPGADKEHVDEQVAGIISAELDRIVAKYKDTVKSKLTEKNRVVVLTRTNNELRSLSKLLRQNKIPASIRRDGTFFNSEAVIDFYIMVCSYMFSDEPKYLFNYLLTPYAGEIDAMDINVMERLNGDYDNLVDYLDHFVDQTSWKRYYKQLRLCPIMSVFKEMLDNESVVDRFIASSKRRKREVGWEENRIEAATRTEAMQYQANLEKLIELLQRNLGGDKVSLYDVYNYLRLAIATNRTEMEAEVMVKDDYESVLCMTVHKAKGLEFDTIIIPYTKRSFTPKEHTEILIDPIEKKVGWNYSGDQNNKKKKRNYPEMKNTYYQDLKDDDIIATAKEETRILYVAMTRAINSLICIAGRTSKEDTWAHLLEEGGVDYE